jgi:hypothetical protein
MKKQLQADAVLDWNAIAAQTIFAADRSQVNNTNTMNEK